jgi:hypothetical protein
VKTTPIQQVGKVLIGHDGIANHISAAMLVFEFTGFHEILAGLGAALLQYMNAIILKMSEGLQLSSVQCWC